MMGGRKLHSIIILERSNAVIVIDFREGGLRQRFCVHTGPNPKLKSLVAH